MDTPLVALAVFAVVALPQRFLAQTPGGNGGKGWINLNVCNGGPKKAFAVQMMDGSMAARINLWVRQVVTVKPSGTPSPQGEFDEGYFDYVIQFDPATTALPISSFASSNSHSERKLKGDLEYRSP